MSVPITAATGYWTALRLSPPLAAATVSPFELLGIVLGLLTAIASAVAAWQTLKTNRLEVTLARYRDHLRRSRVILYLDQDIVLLGPRFSGKTSVAELWTKPWANIDGMPHTNYWTKYEASIFSLGVTTERDPNYDLERPHERVLRARLHDYPGADEFRRMAVEHLPELKQGAVLLLFFDLEANHQGCLPTTKNDNYYSQAFVESFQLPRALTTRLAKVIVVFNKLDKLPRSWSREKIISEVRRCNSAAVQRLDSLFSGILEYHCISATTNEGLIGLLGAAAASGLPDEARKAFREHLRRLEQLGTRRPPDDAPRPEVRNP